MLGNMTPPGVRGDKRLRGGKGKNQTRESSGGIESGQGSF